jgi:hypothetical protein
MNLILLPVYVLKFWYLEAPIKLIIYFFFINKAFFHLFSLPLMLRTFFKPWKNEYREGLVIFSVFMGMVFKTLFIIADLFIFFLLLIFELTVFILFIVFPIIAVYFSLVKII